MKNFLGIPIDGDIIRNERVKQRPIEEFQPIIRAVLEDETIHSFGWQQCTPYFNDGDPCVFSAQEIWVRLVTDEVDEDEYFDPWDYSVDSRKDLGRIPVEWSSGERVEHPYEGPDEDRYHRLRALNAAITAGAFDEVLLSTFGDHADITFTRERILVEEYSHE